MKRSTYSVKAEDKLIVITTEGDQSIAAVKDIRQQTEALLVKRNSPKDILVVHQGTIDTVNSKAIDATRQALREVPFRRIAVVATQPKRLGVTHSIFLESDDNDRFKVFRDERLARDWLKQAGRPLRTKLEQGVARLRPSKPGQDGQ